MNDAIRRATAHDLDAVWRLFEASCALQTPANPGPNWHPGVYPTQDGIADRLAEGTLYVYAPAGEVAAAMVVTKGEDEEYLSVPWNIMAEPDEVAVLHLLVVDPARRGQGVAAQMVDAALEIARARGAAVVHLDVTRENHVARRAYERAGFALTCEWQIFYEDTGLMDFWMFERRV